MFAKDLEHVLTLACQDSDVSPIDAAEVAQRFDALRRYAKLPRGRENRAKALSAAEIAAAILGLAPTNPRWAGLASVVLTDLRPVGGTAASFAGAQTLSAAIETLLTDTGARKSLFFLTLSTAESATNSSGRAILTYEQAGARCCVAFVPKLAVSQLQPGSEREFDFDYFHAEASRSLTLNRTFFNRVAIAVAHAAAFPCAPGGDGSEYDAEEAQQARYKALGVERHSRFLNIGVDAQVTWPNKEMLVTFDNYRLVLMPKTEESMQSIHIDLYANRLNDDTALTVINRFLSMLTWCDDQFAVAKGGWSGNPVPVAVPRRDLAFVTAHDWTFDRKIPPSDQARKALALFREGLNAEEAELGSYAVLSYFKIIEIRYPDGEKAKRWIRRVFREATGSASDDPQMKAFMSACGTETPENYIYKACRHAVAHASTKYPSDSDDFSEIQRLYSASYVLRLLARNLIAKELGVSDAIYSGD